MNRAFSASTDKDFGDSYIDNSRNEKRLLRDTTETYPNTGNYLFPKIFKNGVDELYLDQRLTLSASEFQQFTFNRE